jgi:hypothetical protein
LRGNSFRLGARPWAGADGRGTTAEERRHGLEAGLGTFRRNVTSDEEVMT